MNKVILMGRSVKDADVRYSQGEKPMAIASITLAVDRKFKKEGEQTADFINCKAFGKTAEIIEKYVTKGTKIAVTGRIQTGSYTNKDGVKVYTTDVMIEDLDFCESKSNNQSANTSAPKNDNGNEWLNIPDNLEENGLPF